MTDDKVDYAALGVAASQVPIGANGSGDEDMAEYGQRIATIFCAHGWRPPKQKRGLRCQIDGCDERAMAGRYVCEKHAGQPLTGDALPSRTCSVCGGQAYFGSRCSKHRDQWEFCERPDCDSPRLTGHAYCGRHAMVNLDEVVGFGQRG